MDTPILINARTGYIAQDLERPQPVVVTPGATDDQPPSDALVLFDGRDLSPWRAADRGEADLRRRRGGRDL